MQIVAFPASIAVLLLAAISFLGKYIACKPLAPQTEINAYNYNPDVEDEPTPLPDYLNKTILYSGNWLTWRQSEELMLLEGGPNLEGAECCPSENLVTTPIGGINKDGNYVELYRDGSKQQRFHEVSCKDEIVDKPCRYMEKRFHNRSRCIQKYSYSYAIIVPESQMTQPPLDASNTTKPEDDFTPFSRSDTYMLDYIQVRSGCSCDITPNKKLKDKKNPFKGKKKKRKHANDTID